MTLDKAAEEIDVAIAEGRKKGLAYENPFGGVPSFLRRTYTKDLSGFDVAVTGIPFDQAVTNRPGARFGPRAIREASTLQAGDPPYGWGYSPLETFAVADFGDMAFDYAKVADVPGLIEAHIAGVLATDTACLTLGGDHSILLPSLRAHAAKYGPLALCQFDAHSDTWEDNDPARVDHGTIVYKAVKEGLIDPERSVQIGIRVENDPALGITRIDARTVHAEGPETIAARAKEIISGAKTYLSFDIDALDPAFAPGTGTPVWGGLTTNDAAVMLRALAGIDLVGMDVVEVSPPFDSGAVTAIAGAHVAYELLSLWGWNHKD